MCGIAGFIGHREILEDAVRACLQRMQRRGPDACGAQRFRTPDGRQVLLLHTRLSIIDLDPRANQPYRWGEHWMAFNGELYNYLELAQQLQGDAPLQTRSDTEVFVRLLARQGLAALDQAEGMWAFALYDGADGSLVLCRDRFGEKPLYLLRTPEGVYFGSEPKFVFALLGRTLPPNTEQLRRYLVNGYKSLYKTRDTFFVGLEELEPAHCLRISPEGVGTPTRYWTPAYAPQADMSYDEAVRGARTRLERSLELRLRSDVPLAFLMSGGVDSNALISIAHRVFGHDVHGFTILNQDARYDERAIVEEAVAEYGIRHTGVGMGTEDFLDRLRALVAYHDAPVSTITYYVQWLLMRHIQDAGYKISISGTGADEMFTGYYDHHLLHLAEIHGTPAHAPTLEAWQTHIQPLVRNPFLRDPDLFVRDRSFRDHIYLGNEGFAQYLTQPFQEAFEEAQYAESLLRNRMLNEMFHEAVRVILHEDDLNAMYYSIENRSPFLDRELFEFCYRIPNPHLIRDGFNKAVLRDAVRDLAPGCVIGKREKVGFNAPVEAFLDLDDPNVRATLLAESPVFDIIRRDRIEGLLASRGLPNSESKFLFYFVNTKLFLEQLLT